MKTELHYYDIYPKVFPAGKEIEITVKPLGEHAMFKSPENVVLRVLGIEDGSIREFPKRNNNKAVDYTVDENGVIRFKNTFEKEQQYFIRFCDKETDKKLVQLNVYAVADDLCGRYPLIGDLHMHTCRSDGRQAPAIVCANYRKHGYDFFAITDHERYYPSLEAINAYKDVPIEFNICVGEEVHMPRDNPEFGCDPHIVNFGGNYSVNGLCDESDQIIEAGDSKELRSFNGAECPDVMTADEYRKEVLELAETLDIPDGIEKFTYAGMVWVFNHIKKAGGLGIFCHPYWISNVNHVPENIVELLMERQPFDAYEVLGGENYYEQNGLQTHRYYDDRAMGRKYPIVGSTDSHSSVNNENAYVASTMVFSPANEKDAIIASIKDFYSVAIDGISKEFRLVGDLRLARYACFLLKEYFPLHDDLCYEEGRAMKDYVCGVEGAKETLEFISGRVQKQREKYFAF